MMDEEDEERLAFVPREYGHDNGNKDNRYSTPNRISSSTTSSSANNGVRRRKRKTSTLLMIAGVLTLIVMLGMLYNGKRKSTDGAATSWKEPTSSNDTQTDDNDNDDEGSNEPSKVTKPELTNNDSPKKIKKEEKKKSTKSDIDYMLHPPPLSEWLDSKTGKIKASADVSWMLDYVVADFPKCGTSYLMYFLERNNETYINPGEVCSMNENAPEKVVQLYHNLSRRMDDGRIRKAGLKCPRELETEFALSNYATHFPNIDFIISMRHPIWWFQSFYNFRAYKAHPVKLPDPIEMIGPCQIGGYPYVPHTCSGDCRADGGNQNICTDRAAFHRALSRLGKTPLSSREELKLLGHHSMSIERSLKSRIFLMEIGQLDADNPSSEAFVNDLRKFLRLEQDMIPLKHYNGMPNRYSDEEAKKALIDICHKDHAIVRDVLLHHGRDASEWIRRFFLKSPDVVVSNRDEFLHFIDQWNVDPCPQDEDNDEKADKQDSANQPKKKQKEPPAKDEKETKKPKKNTKDSKTKNDKDEMKKNPEKSKTTNDDKKPKIDETKKNSQKTKPKDEKESEKDEKNPEKDEKKPEKAEKDETKKNVKTDKDTKKSTDDSDDSEEAQNR